MNLEQIDKITWKTPDGRMFFYDQEDGTYDFVSHVLGDNVIERFGYKSLDDAVNDCERLTPSEMTVRNLIEDEFNSLPNDKRLNVAYELYSEHDYGFEWSDVFDLECALEGADSNKLVDIVLHANVHNDMDPVRYDKSGALEQVTYDELYYEVNNNEDEIVDAICEVMSDGFSICSAPELNRLMESIVEGRWSE